MFTKKPETSNGTGILPQSPIATSPMPKPVQPMSPMVARPSRGLEKSTPSVIGSDLTIMGNMISKGEIQVDGEVQGDINCLQLVVGEKAKITGGVVAEDVVVRGHVLGSIRGMRVTLQTSSHVEGDIYHQSLAIEQGAYFEGKSRRAEDPSQVTPKYDVPVASGKAPGATG
jgi:cytoskeletal protein CcmA (bactofilin family)